MARRMIPVQNLFKDIRFAHKEAGAFTRVPNQVIGDSTISNGAFRLYVKLLSYVGWDDRSNTVWPKKKTLAKELGCSVKTVTRNLKELQELGLMKPTRTRNDLPAFDLFVPVEDNSGREEGQRSPEAPPDSSKASGGSTAISISRLPAVKRQQVEPKNETPLKKKVQGNTSRRLTAKLQDQGLARDRALALIEENGEDLLEEALVAAARPGVRDPAAFIVAYVGPTGLGAVNRMKDYLKDGPYPEDHRDYEPIYDALISRFGSEERVMELIGLAQADLRRLVDADATSEAQQRLASRMHSKASVYIHIIDRHQENDPERRAFIRKLMASVGAEDFGRVS